MRFADGQPVKEREPVAPPEPLAETYQALALAVRDHITKNGFLGLCWALRRHRLGVDPGHCSRCHRADKVQAVMMPFRYTAQMSVEDAKEQAERMGWSSTSSPSSPCSKALWLQLAPLFEGTARDTTEENLQARAAAVVLLMALLQQAPPHRAGTTGNKSEMAVGYATLYGDMAGGFDVLKDASPRPGLQAVRVSQQRGIRDPAAGHRSSPVGRIGTGPGGSGQPASP